LYDLQETFDTLRRYKMKLNPSKCAFGVALGKFLGFMVSQRGIKANPEGEKKNPSDPKHGAPKECQGCLEPHWTSSCP